MSALYCHHHISRSISSTPVYSTQATLPLSGWMDKIKGVLTGKEDQPESQTQTKVSAETFTLLNFADQLKMARKVGSFKQFMVGRSSEATFSDAFEKQEAILRYLGTLDPTGEHLESSQKSSAAKHCNCTIADVENTLSKYTWAKEAQKKIEKLKEEGKPIPTTMGEVQKLMGSTPVDIARSNLAKSGQISRNALCPCGSKKRYKRCCGSSDGLKTKAAD
ncbi:hypothetical protein AMTR_s00057p00181010 [Amborella trichopoda]|uniref:SecA Wing/Scaffold domain-containing protein n=2 Tax=Amborella trichopoda TaxID=13333 RepID=U5CUD8_AMBTC|nr:hypothetical protein AMTR_s00057p00181010 [Amborella trichopoda]